MAREIAAHFEALRTRLDVRVVILRAEGRHFCAGAGSGNERICGARSGRAQSQMAMQKVYSGVVRAMRSCPLPQPIIALVHGAACGGGFSRACLRRTLRAAAGRTNERGLYPGRSRRLRHGLRLSPSTTSRPGAPQSSPLSGRFVEAERALRAGLGQRDCSGGSASGGGIGARRRHWRRRWGWCDDEGVDQHRDRCAQPRGRAFEDRQQVILIDTEDHRGSAALFSRSDRRSIATRSAANQNSSSPLSPRAAPSCNAALLGSDGGMSRPRHQKTDHTI